MMKKLVVALFGLAMVAALAGAQSDSAGVKAVLQARYDGLIRAFTKKDVGAYEKVLSADYVLVRPNGQRSTRKQVLDSYKTLMGMVKSATWKRSIKTVKLSKGHASAVVSGDFRGKMAGQDGKLHDFRLVATTIDTWVHNKSGWVLTLSKVMKNNATVDGKPVPM